MRIFKVEHGVFFWGGGLRRQKRIQGLAQGADPELCKFFSFPFSTFFSRNLEHQGGGEARSRPPPLNISRGGGGVVAFLAFIFIIKNAKI